MNRSDVLAGWFSRVLATGFLACFLAACATTPKIDWDSLIGNYTYDQAVLELGPPDRMAPLTDGTKVAEWTTSRGYSHGFVTSIGPHFYHPYFYGPPAFSYYSEPPSPDRVLRLTFTPDGRLAAWQRVYR
jgi:hypothetical protein